VGHVVLGAEREAVQGGGRGVHEWNCNATTLSLDQFHFSFAQGRCVPC
jgi:hypothetical protein